MHRHSRHLLIVGAVAVLSVGQAWAAEEGAPAGDDSSIIVTGVANQAITSATSLSLTLRETPQSISIINRERIDDFALTNVNDLLAQAVGINVERVETDRTYYNSRGFDITSFQLDGIGLPLIWGIQYGDLDTALFENVETIRGANALLTGIGNPSATINYVRKRPLDHFQATGDFQLGSRDLWRGEGDVSVPLTDTVAARITYAHEERDSYLDHNRNNRDVISAIVSWQVTPQLKATAGYSRQENNSDGVLWGALPLVYSDGTHISYPRSASTSADWTYWNTTDTTAFAEIAYGFTNGWSVKGVFTYKRFEENAKLLYAYGTPDPVTGLGVHGMAGIYPSDYKQYLGDFYASGPVRLFGREHSLAFGLSTAKRDGWEYEGFSFEDIVYSPVDQWDRASIAEPDFPDTYLAARSTDRLTRAYGAAHLSLADNLKAVVGASAIWLKSTGYSYGADLYRKDSKLSPYAGLVADLTTNISLYASYTDIYNPQTEVDVNNVRLDPAKGTSIEAGVKSEWRNGRLYATAAIFRARQKGLAEFAGTFDADGAGQAGDSYYRGVDTTSKGFELEIAGHITENWSLSGGYTWLDIEDPEGNDTRTWLPTQTLKLSSTYAIPELNDLKLGAQLRWQNAIRAAVDVGTYRQKGYAVLDLMAGIRVVDHVRARVNVRNVTNKRYLNSLMWEQAYYAPPRNVLATLSVEY
ncbi:TonB-dependent siderophore receptor [Sphingobium lactosutens]|uniref:TonB-dependent siderophore receptor n=1 Tax=Sphingobium lactosutens TaxID=522773 RepID=UPI0015B8AF80|nr:TonB-dependent siderophore receptor [Sphingobium lactosutens]NWK97655.1 TonB-dependent siderophore receptor [Sphingobium lactosutens]